MKRALSFVPSLGFFFVLFVVATTESHSVERLMIPTDVTGTQGDCLRLTEENYRERWERLGRLQTTETEAINIRRERTLYLLEIAENYPGIKWVKELADWIYDIIFDLGYGAAEEAVNQHYDNEIGIAEGVFDNSRNILNRKTNASVRHCRTLPLTHPPDDSGDYEGLESDPTQLFNQQFNWGAFFGMGGNTPCGDYSPHSIPKRC